MKAAILDMYDGTKNLGMNAILEIIARYPEIEVEVFDVRSKCEIPSLDYDLYLSTGGPGSPLDGDGIWERAFYFLMDRVWQHNQNYADKKYAFFICHSFQMICHYLSLGSVVHRRKQSLGVFPVTKTKEGLKEPMLDALNKKFYVADARRWQFIQPNKERMKRLGCKVLAYEKERFHVPFERAVMAMRFSPEWVGVQFHPEASSKDMISHFSKEEVASMIIKERSEKRYRKIMGGLENFSQELDRTYDTILPFFLEDALSNFGKSQREDS